MILDLTTMLTPDHPMIAWAKTKENPHIAMGHVGTHLDTYEKTKIPLEYFRSRGVLFQVVGIGEVTEAERFKQEILFYSAPEEVRNTPMVKKNTFPIIPNFLCL